MDYYAERKKCFNYNPSIKKYKTIVNYNKMKYKVTTATTTREEKKHEEKTFQIELNRISLIW